MVHNIRNYRNVLGEDMCQCLLFLHSFTGCDTTSTFCGIGKGTHFLKMINSRPLQQLTKSFLLTAKSKVDVAQEGLKIIRILYNIRNDESLCQFRYRRLVEKIVKAHNSFKPERFPQTEDASKFHSFRAYLQLQQWIDPKSSIDPLNWGGAEINGQFIPVDKDLPPAPKKLLEIISCKCKGNCSRCSCQKKCTSL